jgi:uncharacterized SAM-binding protein YcdF (DUF218 family)
MFIFKKVISQFFFPMPLCLGMCFAGLTLLWLGKRERMGKGLLTVGLLALTAFSYRPVSDGLLRPFERQYPCYVKGRSPPVKFVVVLGGGHTSEPGLPATSAIGDESLKRLVEAIRVHRDNPGSKLVLSGGKWLDPVANAEVLAQVAETLGVDRSEMLLESESKDTAEEAVLLKELLKDVPFALVTSANHLPRSMALFADNGLTPVPVPADFCVKNGSWGPDAFFPSAHYLKRSERVFYELMGILWRKSQKL